MKLPLFPDMEPVRPTGNLHEARALLDGLERLLGDEDPDDFIATMYRLARRAEKAGAHHVARTMRWAVSLGAVDHYPSVYLDEIVLEKTQAWLRQAESRRAGIPDHGGYPRFRRWEGMSKSRGRIPVQQETDDE